jgi:hypothetical protein
MVSSLHPRVPLTVYRSLTKYIPVGVRTLSCRVGATQSRDLGRSSGGSQQDSCVGAEVEAASPTFKPKSFVYLKYADSQRIINVSWTYPPLLLHDRSQCLKRGPMLAHKRSRLGRRDVDNKQKTKQEMIERKTEGLLRRTKQEGRTHSGY